MAVASIGGSILLLHSSLSDTIDSQLDHAHKMVYQDLKHRELMLVELLISHGQRPAEISTELLETEIRSYQPQLDLQLYDSHADLTEPLRALVEKVTRSNNGLRHITYDERTETYALTFVEPAIPARGVLLLQLTINQNLLQLLSEQYIYDFALYTAEGLLIGSNNTNRDRVPQLPTSLLAKIASKRRLYRTDFGNIEYRSLYAPLPLGNEDILYLVASHSHQDLRALLLTHSWRLLVTVVLALALVVIIYYRLLKQTLMPLKYILETIHQVAKGNLTSRAQISANCQVSDLGSSLNQMLDQLEILYENRLEVEKNTALTQETLRYSNHLKKKNLEIEKANIQLQEQYDELTALFDVSRSLTTALDQDLLLEKIFGVFRESLHCDRIVLLLYKQDHESLEVIKTTGLDISTVKGLTFKIGEGISGIAAATMQPIYSADLSIDDRNLSYKGRWVSSGSLFSMPMVIQNRLIGVLNIHHPQTNAFNQVTQQMARAIADQAAISIENSRLYEKTLTLSATDDLTGLANRRQFQEILQREWAQSRRYQGSFSVAMIDIDHFKSYNDTHGHPKGDVALKKVAALLLQNTRGIDLVARYGGEEFILLLPKTDRAGCMLVANKLCKSIENAYFYGMERSQPQHKLTISIGISSFPDDSTEIYKLLNFADQALYQAKHLGRNCAIGWTADTQQTTQGPDQAPAES